MREIAEGDGEVKFLDSLHLDEDENKNQKMTKCLTAVGKGWILPLKLLEGLKMVSIRMQRKGRKNAPFYTIVAADSRDSRDGRFLEKLGHYRPHRDKGQELSGVDAEAIGRWAGRGAVISDSVRTLLKRNGIQFSF